LALAVFDLADIYGNYEAERCFGLALKASPTLRDRLLLITKCGLKLVSDKFPQHRIKYYDTTKQHIIASAEQSLKHLHTDRIDLLLIHRPDPLMDADEVAEAFTQLKQSGKVLNFGVSNFSPAQFDLIGSRLSFPLMTNQVEFSVLHTQPLFDGTLDQCQTLNISPMAWSPLAGGRLFKSHEEQPSRVRSMLQTIGAELGLTIDQVAMAWIAMHPARVVPITGSGKIENIRLAMEASKVKLSRQQWFAILAASQGHEVP